MLFLYKYLLEVKMISKILLLVFYLWLFTQLVLITPIKSTRPKATNRQNKINVRDPIVITVIRKQLDQDRLKSYVDIASLFVCVYIELYLRTFNDNESKLATKSLRTYFDSKYRKY